MTKDKLAYFSLIILFSCTGQPKFTGENVSQYNFELEKPKQLTSLSHSEIQLDSTQRKKWTDKIMGYPYYGARGLATFDRMNGFEVVAVETLADDWNKSFLLTLDSKGELIDFIAITDGYGDAIQDESGNETIEGFRVSTDFLDSGVFVRTTISEMTYYYQQKDELTEKDSIIEYFRIDDKGKINKLAKDSIRIRGQKYER